MGSLFFPKFDVASDHSDHHFTTKPASSGNNGPHHKRIMQEWKLLDNNLPDSIFVRVYETRVDLLRAAIVGARGTPYHGGLFFFDVYFPPEFPSLPPLVQYKSFGHRINPNLYASGKVCLSLLNTWAGQKSECWDPNNSNVIQVLLSIQALVLNEKPYFNEPGYESSSSRRSGEKRASAYNEDAFILICKTMLYVLRSPPKNFVPLVNAHFKDQAEFILSACDAYRKGLVKIGQYNGDLDGSSKVKVSNKFNATMDQVYGQLVTELARTGALIERFIQQLRQEMEKKVMEKDKAMKGRVGKTFVKKLKKIFFLGFKNNKTSKTIPVSVVQAA